MFTKEMTDTSRIMKEMADGERCILCGEKPTKDNTLDNRGMCHKCWHGEP